MNAQDVPGYGPFKIIIRRLIRKTGCLSQEKFAETKMGDMPAGSLSRNLIKLAKERDFDTIFAKQLGKALGVSDLSSHFKGQPTPQIGTPQGYSQIIDGFLNDTEQLAVAYISHFKTLLLGLQKGDSLVICQSPRPPEADYELREAVKLTAERGVNVLYLSKDNCEDHKAPSIESETTSDKTLCNPIYRLIFLRTATQSIVFLEMIAGRPLIRCSASMMLIPLPREQCGKLMGLLMSKSKTANKWLT